MAKIPKNWPTHFPYAPWYLDATAGSWEFVAAWDDKKKKQLAILPFHIKQKWSLRLLTPPPLCPRLGPHIYYPDGLTEQQKQSLEWKLLNKLEEQLPKVHHAKINYPYNLTNGLAWQMKGWEQKVRYSYCLDLSQDLETIWKGFKPSLRNKIRKAKKSLNISKSDDWQIPFNLTQKNFKYRNTKKQLTTSFIKKLDEATKGNNSRAIFIAKDNAGQNHAAIWLFLDKSCAYNLLLGSDPDLRKSGAAPFLLWHSIQYAKSIGLQTFDFEGSHIPGVEAFFRSFGARARPYHQFTKTVKWLKALKIFI